MNRSLDSKTQPSGSQLPLDAHRFPPMESEADFFNRHYEHDWHANRSTYTPEPEEDPHTSPVPVVSHSPLPPADITTAPIEVFKISSIPFAFY